jgi:hypothetical protein
MSRRSAAHFALFLWLTGGIACDQPDLSTALQLVPGITGYHLAGLSPDKQNRLVPSITFQLKNIGDVDLTYVDLSVAFWRVGDDGEKDDKQIRGISATPLKPGSVSESITVDSSVGYTSPVTTAEAFTSSEYKDFIVKVFAKRNGKTTKLGEYTVEKRVLPSVPASGSHP